jgi:hypothetical protein
MTQVQVLLGRADLHNIINTLVKQFKGTGIRYWVTDVIHMGEILISRVLPLVLIFLAVLHFSRGNKI